ncbi:MAG: NapC/NirT family cytochrome c [Acidobacteria bacterium]|nr:NapC/NirT family cytochrome c [Acidobacteriota bacterium]
MSGSDRLRDLARLVFHLGNNKISLAGTVLTTGSAFTLVWFWVMEATSHRAVNPYVGILLFLLLPGLFVIGLMLIPLGMWLRRRRLAKEGALPTVYPQIDLGTPSVRNAILLVILATGANIVLMGNASIKGVEYMDSNQFCGLTCHTVMAPEYTAFLNSPHSRVGCAQCHIGPGAGWFVKSKLSGTRQLFAVAFKTFSRPIPSPVDHLRPARETCEQCHWPQKFHGDKLLVRTKFGEDEANTPSTTVLLLKIGGTTWQGKAGIHGRHLDNEERIHYISVDGRRQEIPKVTYRDDSGKLVEYVSDDLKKVPADKLAKAESRAMDCVDCHNRPTHAFELPDRAVDKAMMEGRVSRDLPFVKKTAVALLKKEYPSREAAAAQISAGIADFYKTTYPEVFKQKQALVEAAAVAVKEIYLRNIFPEMKINWGTHPNQIGHEESAGCFRCHDGSHKAADGRVIEADCTTCHTILAQDEKDPKVLKDISPK